MHKILQWISDTSSRATSMLIVLGLLWASSFFLMGCLFVIASTPEARVLLSFLFAGGLFATVHICRLIGGIGED